jgi:hypothetical protein
MAQAEKEVIISCIQYRFGWYRRTIRLECTALAIFSSLLRLRFARLAGTGVGGVWIFGTFA